MTDSIPVSALFIVGVVLVVFGITVIVCFWLWWAPAYITNFSENWNGMSRDEQAFWFTMFDAPASVGITLGLICIISDRPSTKVL